MKNEISCEQDYKAALTELEALIDQSPLKGTPNSDRLELLSIIIHDYESKLIKKTQDYDKVLHDLIVKIVDDNSGGIKFTELIATITADNHDSLDNIENFPDRLERVIRESKILNVLDYTFRDLNRCKMFVYTA
jgi:hypothetical protein